ncbi:zinc finger CCCH domain-containing protein 33-like [Dendrobium catenatum]|uniref:Zinc finger CCCH domain-containing protein 33 n=1 Tax=Dendrobium catenatum TaxID=906689 RepID=A0A2I0XER0_9ASPA|nr:zinc finger CCCH domain-containing protein 33-like [Dendrobium catenatum]PKU86407.1 Zinc finger CCCH domain-containing protein 33 [Dendrobium catenatum]
MEPPSPSFDSVSLYNGCPNTARVINQAQISRISSTMSRGNKKQFSQPSQLSMDADDSRKTAPSRAAAAAAAEDTVALLLELTASDDLAGFKQVVEKSDISLDASAQWYSRSVGPVSSPARKMAYERRTLLAIAALYGSTSVLSYILSRNGSTADVNRRCGSDGVTALHCAAAGGSAASLQAVRLLIEASADVDAVDAMGNRPGDVIAKQFSASMARELEVLLKAPCPRVSSPSKLTGEKKEYPPDLTLPDIKNGIYGTDEFRMYTFKVKPCSRAYSHDWTECPFVHPGENARRRDPRKYTYSCVPCPDFRKASCLKGDSCEYAHGVFESWLHPAQYRTRLCKDEIGCNRRVCFFAHKTEELRSVNPTTASVAGLALSSPRSSQMGISSLDMAAALMMMQSTPASPISPSASSALASTSAWMNLAGSMAQPPVLQLPSSRLKSSVSARDIDYEHDMLGLEGYQQKLFDDISSIASPRSNWKAGSLNSVASRVADYNDLFGSLDSSILSPLQNLSLKQATSAATGLQMNQSVSQQLLSGYGGSLPSSPTMNSSPFGLEHSMAKAILNSRQAAFVKRSHSFIDRAAVARNSVVAPPQISSCTTPSLGLSDWGSPKGKLDWGIQEEELNKMRKSASFTFRSNQSNNVGAPVTLQQQQKQYQGNGAVDFLSWDHLYAEQDQLVA